MPASIVNLYFRLFIFYIFFCSVCFVFATDKYSTMAKTVHLLTKKICLKVRQNRTYCSNTASWFPTTLNDFVVRAIRFWFKVSKGAKIWNRYNQVPHLTQDTNQIFFLRPIQM